MRLVFSFLILIAFSSCGSDQKGPVSSGANRADETNQTPPVAPSKKISAIDPAAPADLPVAVTNRFNPSSFKEIKNSNVSIEIFDKSRIVGLKKGKFLVNGVPEFKRETEAKISANIRLVACQFETNIKNLKLKSETIDSWYLSYEIVNNYRTLRMEFYGRNQETIDLLCLKSKLGKDITPQEVAHAIGDFASISLHK